MTVADDLPDVSVGDPVRLRAALENLLDNAVKFTAQGDVRLAVRGAPAKAGRVKLTLQVSDSGIGLTRAEIKRLFRPHAQASADIARRYGGAGLGLAVVKRLAKLMGGDLTVTSTPGRGSTFSLYGGAAARGGRGPPARREQSRLLLRLRAGFRFCASKIILMAVSSSTPSWPSLGTAPISSAPARRRSRHCRAATTSC